MCSIDWNDLIDDYMNEYYDTCIENRIVIIEQLNNKHFYDTGENLPSPLLVKLANWLLQEILQSTDQGKRDMEYPFHSGNQEKRRSAKELCVEYKTDSSKTSYNMDYLNSKYRERLSSLCKRKY
jgi:hypothetical protein